MSRRTLTGLDSAFLAIERRGHPLHVMGMILLDPSSVPGGYRFDAFRSFIEQRLPALTPLRRRLVEVPGGLGRPFWVEEPEIDLDWHLRRSAVPGPGGPREIAAMAAEMMEEPLDRSRPLWSMKLVEGLEGGRLALLAKLHHSMMDGLAGVKLMASIFATTPELPRPAATPSEAPDPDPAPGSLGLLGQAIPWIAALPARLVGASLGTARLAVSRLLLPGAGEATPTPAPARGTWLNAAISPRRSVAHLSLPVADLERVARAGDASVNDVLLAVVGGALRQHLGVRGLLPETALVAGVPMQVRRERDDRANAATLIALGLETGLADPAERLKAIRAAMRVNRRYRAHTLGDLLTGWAEVPPPLLFSLLAEAYLRLDIAERLRPLYNLVVSTVPGPPRPLYLAGARLVGLHPLGPIYTGLGLNITGMRRGPSLDLGLVACPDRIPDLWDLADGLAPALEDLAKSVPRRPRRPARLRV